MLMQRITLRVPADQVSAVDRLAERGEYPSRSEAIRAAIRALVDDRILPPTTTPAATDGGTVTADHANTTGSTRSDRERARRRLARLPVNALEGRYIDVAFERAGSYHAVRGEIVTVRDQTPVDGSGGRRRLVIEDDTVVPTAGVLDYTLAQSGKSPDPRTEGDDV